MEILKQVLFFIGLTFLYTVQAQDNLNNNVADRNKKALSVFQVVRFPNTACVGSSSYNGTCYTSSECLNKAGTASGTCANGFGVCCTFILGCGGSAAQNCTYFQVSNAISGQCSAQICKCSADICQLRLDFQTFVISGPSTATDTNSQLLNGVPSGAGTAKAVSTATQCLTDTFTISSPGGYTPPVICGTNTNQHAYVDASNSCNNLNFQLGSTGSSAPIAARNWKIKVTQISCHDNNRLAPSGCTQYYTGTSGTFQSFNFGATTPVELARQNQQICFRQEKNFCRICFYAVAAIDFAVSGSTLMGRTMPCCNYGTSGTKTTGPDCVVIPGASSFKTKIQKPGVLCGASMGLVTADKSTTKTVCSSQTPFTFQFITDNWSFLTTGTVMRGFKLNYFLTTC